MVVTLFPVAADDLRNVVLLPGVVGVLAGGLSFERLTILVFVNFKLGGNNLSLNGDEGRLIRVSLRGWVRFSGEGRLDDSRDSTAAPPCPEMRLAVL